MPDHILVCPTAFKGTLSAIEVADAMAAGARAVDGVSADDVMVLPLSDGGNGLLDALGAAAGGETRTARVPGPDGRPVRARYLVQDDRVVVETAEACGLHLVPPGRRDPLLTTTIGVGALLLEAAAALPHRDAGLVIGLGGSATVDAGAGMAAALGWTFLDDEGEPIVPCGSGLLRLRHVLPPVRRPLPSRLRVLADVTNPLLGPLGAARVYGPQKGASPRDVSVLERALARWVEVIERQRAEGSSPNRATPSPNRAETPSPDRAEDRAGSDAAGEPGPTRTSAGLGALEGGGAAGGLGAAFAALLDAPPERGAAWVLDALGFDARLATARAVVTGEGEWDAQSSMGKVTGEVAARARAAGVPVLVVAGRVSAPLPQGAVDASAFHATDAADGRAFPATDGADGDAILATDGADGKAFPATDTRTEGTENARAGASAHLLGPGAVAARTRDGLAGLLGRRRRP